MVKQASRAPHRLVLVGALRLLLVVALLAATWPPRPALAQEGDELALREFGYNDLSARTMFGSVSYFFPVPRGQVPAEGSELVLIYSHSPLLVPERSTMTVRVNGESLTSVFLTPQNRDRARLEVPLPRPEGDARFEPTGYFVEVQFYMRLTDDECEETENPALWATVHGDSFIRLPLAAAQEGPQLEELGGLFVPTGLEPDALAIALADDAQPEELAAAGLVAYQMGRWAASSVSNPQLELGESLEAGQVGALVGQASALPVESWGDVEVNAAALRASGGSIPDAQGVLALRQAGAAQLLVSGGSPEAVLDAASALAESPRRVLLEGPYAILTGREPAARTGGEAWSDGAASFAQLGLGARQVMGPGEHVIDLAFERPAGWVLEEGAALEVALSTAASLREDTSWVSAAINGYELGTQPLIASRDANGERYRWELPVGLLNNDLDGRPIRRLQLQLRLFLDLPERSCEPIAGASARATLLPTSAWILPHSTFGGLDLGRFPAPLLEQSAALRVVLPASPERAEVEAGLRVMAALGRWAQAQPAQLPILTTAAQLTDTERDAGPLLLVGGPERNALSALAAEENPDLFDTVLPVAYRLEGRGYGALRLVPSPWAEGQALLAVTGEGAEGLDLALEALLDGERLAQLQGDEAIIADGLPAQILADQEVDVTVPDELAPQVIVPLTERLETWQVVGAVLLGAVAMAVFLLLIARYGRRSAA